MNKKNKLILPFLPDNLESLNKMEDEIRTDSILFINSEADLKNYLDLIYISLNIIFDVSTVYKSKNDDELIIQYLGVRLFNTGVTSIRLLLTGYYQNSYALQRDLLETGYLLDYFSIDTTKISEWKYCSKKDRLNNFKQDTIRKALDKRDGLVSGKRTKLYQTMCEYATHPTFLGFKLLAPNGFVKIGPFYNKKYLKSILQEFTLLFSYITSVFLVHFKNLPNCFLKVRINFYDTLKMWAKKYLNTNISDIDTERLKQLVELI